MKLQITLNRELLSPDNFATEQKAIFLAEKIFALVCCDTNNVAEGARALDLAMRGLLQCDGFGECLRSSSNLTNSAQSIGLMSIEVVE